MLATLSGWVLIYYCDALSFLLLFLFSSDCVFRYFPIEQVDASCQLPATSAFTTAHERSAERRNCAVAPVLPDENFKNTHIFKNKKKENPHKSAHLKYGYQMQDIFKQNAKMKFIFTIGDFLFHFYS